MAELLEKVDPAWAWSPWVPSDENRWDRRRVAHLYRRAAFGACAKDVNAAVAQSLPVVVEQLLRDASRNNESNADADGLVRAVLATGDPKQLAAWWSYLLLHSNQPLRERMTLFWHGHFATSADKVTEAALMLEQNQLFRQHALGNFRTLTQSISRNSAMLSYLDSATNRKAHPNENFARELMELFCLGEGNYSEKDVQELARCFTGWEIKQSQFRFNRFQHDAETKTILGKSDAFPDGASVDWVVDQPQAARFIAGKLFRQFVCDEPAPPTHLIDPLADELRRHDWHVEAAVRRILTSQIFYSPHALGRKVRSPVDLGVGLLRSLEASTNAHELASDLQQNGQGLFFPPNVKGWDGGRAWINSSTILGRANMVGRLLSSDSTRFGGGKLPDYLARQGAETPEQVVDLLSDLLLAVPLKPSGRAGLIQLHQQTADRSRALASMVHALATLPEFQLG